MLNPSTADESADDPTVAKCQRYARAWGYGRLLVGNVFSLRSTDPAHLYSHPDPVGPENDVALDAMAGQAKIIVCAWGNHAALGERGRAVEERLRTAGHTLHVLRINLTGAPAHPLYLPQALVPKRWVPTTRTP